MIGKAIHSLLSNDADVSALVGTNIYPSLAIEDIGVNYIVYEEESRTFNDSKDGKSCVDDVVYDIGIYTDSLAKANDLGLKVRNVLDRYSGTVEGLDIQGVQFISENTEYDDSPNRVFLKMQNYSFRYDTIYATLARIIDLTGSAASTTQNDLLWSDVAPTAVGYEVWRSNDLEGWTLINTTAANATSYSDTGLTLETQYYYRVRPTDGTNGGEWSNIIGVRTDNVGVAACPIGAELNKTGQTVSYEDFDDGYYEDGRDVDFLTLSSNNPHGNTFKFTDELGGQTFTNDIVIDWSTYDGTKALGWWRITDATSRDWANIIAYASTISIASFVSGWQVPNPTQIHSIYNYGITSGNDKTNYVPFNGMNLNAWTSTTINPSQTTRAIASQSATTNSPLFSFLKASTRSRHIYCRNFTNAELGI
jgi:hypothetical protein